MKKKRKRLPLSAAFREHMGPVVVLYRLYHNGERSIQLLSEFEALQALDALAWPGDPAVKRAKLVRGERAKQLIDGLIGLGF